MFEYLYTIGFTQKTAKNFFSLLCNNDVKRLVDTRLNNTGQLAGFTKRDDLEYFAKTIGGMDYFHWMESAPEDSALKAYKSKSISWDEYAKEYIDTISRRRIELAAPAVLGSAACLLCSEAKPHHCHRSLLAKYLTEKLQSNIRVIHL